LWCQMDKRKNNEGFTAIEMMLTLMIVSIILIVTTFHIPEYEDKNFDDEVMNISYLFQSTQTNAIKYSSPRIVEIDYTRHHINIKSNTGNLLNNYPLTSCKFKKGGLERFIYNKNGDTTAFGTIRMNCNGKTISFIFQINKGRFRIEK
jgi:prepilin-type N-terminal cleavage/methylation domain-containing protein